MLLLLELLVLLVLAVGGIMVVTVVVLGLCEWLDQDDGEEEEGEEEGVELSLPLLVLPSESLPPKAETAALGPRRPCFPPSEVCWFRGRAGNEGGRVERRRGW